MKKVQQMLNFLHPKANNCVLEVELPTHCDSSSPKAANAVIIEISISGCVKSTRECSDSGNSSLTLIKYVKHFGSNLEVEASVRAEARVFQYYQIGIVKASRTERVSCRGSGAIIGKSAGKSSSRYVTGVRICGNIRLNSSIA